MNCPYCHAKSKVVKKGSFAAKNGRFDRIPRFFCHQCRRGFCARTGQLAYRHHKPELNHPLYLLIASGVSQRRIARLLATTQKTVARKMVRLAAFASAFQCRQLEIRDKVSTVEFDEMETFEHTKCKPVAIAVAVESGSRLIIGAKVAQMPAKGRLAAVSKRRYGYRRDKRARALASILESIRKISDNKLLVKSDGAVARCRSGRKAAGAWGYL